MHSDDVKCAVGRIFAVYLLIRVKETIWIDRWNFGSHKAHNEVDHLQMPNSFCTTQTDSIILCSLSTHGLVFFTSLFNLLCSWSVILLFILVLVSAVSLSIEIVRCALSGFLCWLSDENNDSFFPCFFQPKALGQALLSEVFLRGNLIESDYFGLEFQNMQMNWVRTSASVYFVSRLKWTHRNIQEVTCKLIICVS